MHAEFPKLFSEISTDGAQRALRWAGVEAFTGIYTKAREEMLARLAFDTKPPAGGHQQEDLANALGAFHEAFSAADPSIELGKRQDQILSAAALMHYFATRSTAAMVVTTTACGGARKAQLPIDLVTAAENALSLLAANRRRRPDLSKVEVEAPKFEYELDFSEVQPNSPTTFQGVFDQIASAVDQALADLVAKFNKSTALLVDAGKKADEELDMLSWVFGQRARLPNKAFADVPANQKPLVFARDLASLTTIYPGPNSVPALFSRAGVKSTGKLSIVDAVNAVSDDWTAVVLKGRSSSPATTPIHFALAKRQETGAGVGWTAGWSAITGIDSGAVLSPITLAELFYREILWLR
ncbi:GTPase-associated system all-helical protein GASH [Novosphingobium sp.]|uniref:GTPase-associated system all-helical protein GASH n=1 Tax=Novosphingobium sp. TaxID=1874826 RepID=UPI00286E7113|nr:GTPase-associated system all-helical protein GASH [Novosphingobium sp.]